MRRLSGRSQQTLRLGLHAPQGSCAMSERSRPSWSAPSSSRAAPDGVVGVVPHRGGVGGHRRGAPRHRRPPRHGVRNRSHPRDGDGVRLARPALGRHRGLQRRRTGRAVRHPAGRRAARGGGDGPAHPVRTVVDRRHAVRRFEGTRRRLRRLRRNGVRVTAQRRDAAGRGRRGQRARARPRRSHPVGHLRAVRSLHAGIRAVGRSGVIPAGRD